MGKKIKITSKLAPKIKDIGQKQATVDPGFVAEALGAEIIPPDEVPTVKRGRR